MKPLSPDNNEDDHELQKISRSVPPEWMSVIDDVGFEMSKIKTKRTNYKHLTNIAVKELSKAHEQHLLPIIRAKDDEEEQTVEILTENIQTVRYFLRDTFSYFEMLKKKPNALRCCK